MVNSNIQDLVSLVNKLAEQPPQLRPPPFYTFDQQSSPADSQLSRQLEEQKAQLAAQQQKQLFEQQQALALQQQQTAFEAQQTTLELKLKRQQAENELQQAKNELDRQQQQAKNEIAQIQQQAKLAQMQQQLKKAELLALQQQSGPINNIIEQMDTLENEDPAVEMTEFIDDNPTNKQIVINTMKALTLTDLQKFKDNFEKEGIIKQLSYQDKIEVQNRLEELLNDDDGLSYDDEDLFQDAQDNFPNFSQPVIQNTLSPQLITNKKDTLLPQSVIKDTPLPPQSVIKDTPLPQLKKQLTNNQPTSNKKKLKLADPGNIVPTINGKIKKRPLVKVYTHFLLNLKNHKLVGEDYFYEIQAEGKKDIDSYFSTTAGSLTSHTPHLLLEDNTLLITSMNKFFNKVKNGPILSFIPFFDFIMVVTLKNTAIWDIKKKPTEYFNINVGELLTSSALSDEAIQGALFIYSVCSQGKKFVALKNSEQTFNLGLLLKNIQNGVENPDKGIALNFSKITDNKLRLLYAKSKFFF